MESLSAASCHRAGSHNWRWQGHSSQPQHFCSTFLLRGDLWRQCVCTLENVEFVLIVPGWFQVQKFSLPNSSFSGKAVKDTEHHLITGAHLHFSPSLIAFAWTSLGSEHTLCCALCTLKVCHHHTDGTKLYTGTQWWDISILVLSLHLQKGDTEQTNMTYMDLGVFHDVAAAEEIAPAGCCWFVSVLYTALLGYPVASPFFLCSTCCQTDSWSAATK